MRRHHVVIGSDDADIGDIMLLHGNFDGFGHGGIAVRQIGTAKLVAFHTALLLGRPNARQINFTGGAGTFDNSLSDFG